MRDGTHTSEDGPLRDRRGRCMAEASGTEPGLRDNSAVQRPEAGGLFRGSQMGRNAQGQTRESEIVLDNSG
jgi:hypothetical protein